MINFDYICLHLKGKIVNNKQGCYKPRYTGCLQSIAVVTSNIYCGSKRLKSLAYIVFTHQLVNETIFFIDLPFGKSIS